MNTLEIAQKYGVPTPETCKGLDWKGETLFYWALLRDSYEYGSKTYDLVFKTHHANEITKSYAVIGIIYFEVHNSDIVELIPAPQIHEIAPLLPEKRALIFQFDEPLILENSLSTKTEDYHFSEAVAQLYLKLKNRGLL